MGYDVLLTSYRGYAKSTGKPTEKGVYQDGEASIRYVIKTLGYEEKNIIVLGRSLGSAVAINVCQGMNLKGMILVTPFTSAKDVVRSKKRLFTFIAGNSYNSLERINKFKKRVLIIHGTEDEIIPYSLGKKLFDNYDYDKKMITIAGGKHNDIQNVDSIKFWGGVKQFLFPQ